MEESKKDKLSEIDKLLRETSSEKRLKFDTIEPTETDTAVCSEEELDAILGDITSPKPTEAEEPKKQVLSAEVVDAILDGGRPEVAPETDDEEVKVEPVRIIDETTTTIELSDSVDLYEEPVTRNKKKQKKAKQKVKLGVGQIILICVFGLALLWCVFFTTDHTLASFGRTPIFCREVQTYEDGSVSFKGLGYKVQFSFDSNNNLTQKCVPFWEDGPNDLIDKGASVGASFE